MNRIEIRNEQIRNLLVHVFDKDDLRVTIECLCAQLVDLASKNAHLEDRIDDLARQVDEMGMDK